MRLEFKVLRLFAPNMFVFLLAKAMVFQPETLTSPCPNTFRYQLDRNNELYGEIGVYSFDENIVRLNVQLSVGNQVNNYNGQIELAYSKERVVDDVFHQRPIKYKLFFPRWENIPPKITKITVNGNVVCTGAPIQMGGWVTVLTTINLQHTMTIKTVPLNARVDNPFISKNDNAFGGKNFGINFKPEVPKDSFIKNPFISNSFINTLSTSTTTEKPRSNTNPENDNVFANNPFLNNHIPQRVPNLTPQSTNVDVNPSRPSRPISTPPSTIRASDICGSPIVSVPLVVNGHSVPRGSFPWLAALFSVTSTGLDYKCSGTLFSKKHVVTAAHCVEQGRKRIRADKLVLVLGKLNIRRWSLSEGEKMIEAEDIKVHPDYVPLTSDADIAVVILSEEVQFTRFIRPICLWSGSDDLDAIVGQKGKVVGWGKDENNNTMTAEPRQATIPIVSQAQCLWSGEAFKYVTSTRTFCAGARNGVGPCNGDSGSGFIMKRNGRWVLRGVVSISTTDQNTQNCDLSNYVVFTDTSKFKAWLFSFIS